MKSRQLPAEALLVDVRYVVRPHPHGARKKFTAKCGQPTNSWKQLGAVVSISGVGFFDIPHSQKPHATNFAELHPVTAIKFVSGCGA